MSGLKRYDQESWQSWLLEDEIAEYSPLADRAADLDAKRRDVSRQIDRLRSRAMSRRFRANGGD